MAAVVAAPISGRTFLRARCRRSCGRPGCVGAGLATADARHRSARAASRRAARNPRFGAAAGRRDRRTCAQHGRANAARRAFRCRVGAGAAGSQGHRRRTRRRSAPASHARLGIVRRPGDLARGTATRCPLERGGPHCRGAGRAGPGARRNDLLLAALTMRFWLVVAAAASFLAAAIAVEAPAALLDRQLDALTHGRLRIADAASTIWNGSGTLIVLPYGARVPLYWHIEALPLLRSRLSGTLGRDATESQQAAFDLASDDFAIRRFAIALPAEALLRAADAPAVIAGAGGTVDVRADTFAMRRGVFD